MRLVLQLYCNLIWRAGVEAFLFECGILITSKLLFYYYDFANLYFVLHDGAVPGPYVSLEAAQEAGAVTMNVGMFLNALISFVIVAFAVFILIKAINTLQEKMLAKEKKAEAAAAPATKTCPFCCTEIPLAATRCPHCTSEIAEVKKTRKSK